MKFTSSKGETHDFHIDIGAMVEMEAKDPDFSIMAISERFDKAFRMTDFVILAKCIGWDLEDLMAHGYNLKDLSDIFVACFGELGFTSAQDTPTS